MITSELIWILVGLLYAGGGSRKVVGVTGASSTDVYALAFSVPLVLPSSKLHLGLLKARFLTRSSSALELELLVASVSMTWCVATDFQFCGRS